MKKAVRKRILALLVASLMLLPCFGAVAHAASASELEYTRTDSYVINYAKTDYGAYGAQAPYLYVSPHKALASIKNLDSGDMESWITSQKVYNMINTTLLDRGGEGAYASIPVYCVDACINAAEGSVYQRINLEDSAYFDETSAGRLRAVYMNSFPMIKDMTKIETTVNSWIDSQEAEHTALSGLTGAEAISATQLAIWTIANGNDVSVTDPYYRTNAYTADELAKDVVNISDSYVSCVEGKRDTTEGNITSLYAYLLSLEPMYPTQKAVSAGSFTDKTVVFKQAEDGTYTATVTVTVEATVGDGDSMVLSALSGEKVASVALTNSTNDYSLVLEGLTAPGQIKLEINGYQTAADVFLFDSNGDRTVSQSMIGYDNSTLPVHSETIVEPDRILNFYKTTVVDDQRIPLENIVFDIYKAADLDDYTLGKVTLPDMPTAAYAAQNCVLVSTVTTGADGKAVCNLSQLDQGDGIYLVVERQNDAIQVPVAPFYVSVPMTGPAGDSWVYEITVEPKNQVVPGPEMEKDVTRIDNNEDTFDIGQLHTWIIRCDIPADIAHAMEYTVTDSLDYRLSYYGNLAVKLAEAASAEHTETFILQEQTDYILQTAETEDNRVSGFALSLTQQGMNAIAEQIGQNSVKDYELRIYFDAMINENAEMGELIPNTSELEYINSVGYGYNTRSDEPVVYTGGLKLLKYDAKDATVYLPDAQFRIARLATDAEVAEGDISKIIYEGKEINVVFCRFYKDAQLQNQVDTAITDTNGTALFNGLAYGEYYLLETKAPDGYNLLSAPVKVTVSADSHLDHATVMVANSSEFVLPSTGDRGIAIYIAVGGVILLAGVFLLITRRKLFG